MRPREARYVGEVLGRLPSDNISPCLNIGSSTADFRRVEQPHIQNFIFTPLLERGVKVIHSDLKQDEGVDIAGSIYDEAISSRLKLLQPRLILCCNMFEHVEDRTQLAALLSDLVPSGGYLLVTVPRSYPIHYDPIDTYFRPSPEELANMFPAFAVEASQVVVDRSYGQDLLAKLGIVGTLAHVGRSAIKFFMFWRGRAAWVAHFHRYLWLFRPYSVSCVVLRKQA